MKTWTIVFLFFFISAAVSAQEIPDSLKYKSVDPDEFLTLISFKGNAVLVDVRMPGEYRKGHIEGAVNIPLSKTEKRYDNLIDSSSVILVYCTSGVRSRWAASKYYELGFRQICNLDGGFEAWKRKGMEVVMKKKERDRK